MGQILVSLCLPTVVYAAVIVLFVVLFRSGRTSMRHPEAVRVANWLHIPESIRAFTERTNKPRFMLALVLITLAYACGISGAVQRAIARPNPVVMSIGEVLSQGQVRSLLKSAVPPRSSILYGPYRWGEGNNPRVCYGASREAVVGSSLTRREIERYYSEWLSGWRREGRGDDVVSWDQTGRFTDSMVALSFVPELLPVDSEVGRAFEKAKAEYLSAYMVSVSAGRCIGPFP